MDSLTIKRQNSFQNKNKATHGFLSRPLIFKLLQEVLEFTDIYVSWSSPQKTDLVANFLNIENRSFEYVSFSMFFPIVTSFT